MVGKNAQHDALNRMDENVNDNSFYRGKRLRVSTHKRILESMLTSYNSSAFQASRHVDRRCKSRLLGLRALCIEALRQTLSVFAAGTPLGRLVLAETNGELGSKSGVMLNESNIGRKATSTGFLHNSLEQKRCDFFTANPLTLGFA